MRYRIASRLSNMSDATCTALLLACGALAVNAGSVLDYTQAAADALHAPQHYIEAIMSTRPVPNPDVAVPPAWMAPQPLPGTGPQ